jgi:hypothetical protein
MFGKARECVTISETAYVRLTPAEKKGHITMLLIISLAFCALEAPLIFRKKFEILLPSIAAVAVLLCYVLSMFQALNVFCWVACAFAAAGLLWLTIQAIHVRHLPLGADWFGLVFTPGFLCFILLAGIYALSAAPHRVYHTDDIYEWAIQPLSLFAHNGLVGPLQHLSPRFMSYTPGMALFQWIALDVCGEWSESAIYFALWLLYAILLIPFTSRIPWKKAWLAPVFVLCAVILPAAFNADAYANLRVDTAVGVCLGYAVTLGWQAVKSKSDRRFFAVSFSLSLALLALLKQDGIAWALLPLSLSFFLGLKEQRVGRRLAKTALIAALPVATTLSWLLFCHFTGLQGQHTAALASNLSQLFSGQLVSAADAAAMLKSVGCAALRGAFPPALWAVVFTGMPIVLALCGKLSGRTARRLSLWAMVGIACFFLGFYTAMLTAFRSSWSSPVDQTAIQPLLDNIGRYGCALWYAFLMLCLTILLSPAEMKAARSSHARCGSLLAGACGLLLLFGLSWGTLANNLLPSRYVENDVTSELDELANSFWTDELPNKADAVVLLASDSYPYNRGWLQYALAPIKLITPFETDLSQADFIRLIQENSVGYFVSEGTENKLFTLALAFAQEGELEDYTVYAVQWDHGEPQLVDIGES